VPQQSERPRWADTRVPAGRHGSRVVADGHGGRRSAAGQDARDDQRRAEQQPGDPA
jgi:hypothetical protein